ncbi:serine/threonine protein kinase [Boudabousia marimammalium]|uniref:Protein kinase domain-containing protein n=1 Tax=Boudabousia marimammalium TaxID=156892 RepID=A0A1Q5PJ65_9ACTO|nr:serine/threonine-protein kinase [Boudabousia marimammalium]OKL45898.1 hypothetical protein BM477_07785 [Boudabousia marimammalium]
MRNLGGYRLLRELGRGASAVVFEAEDEGGNLHALKLLHPALANDEQARERLRREAAAINSIKSEGIARIHDYEVDGVEPFIVTDLVAGSTLAEAVKRRGPMSLQQCLRFSSRLAGILDSVHQAGVVHRDLKPSNIILSPRGPVLVDFGVAQADEGERLTDTGLVMGTAGYVPPEVLQGRAPDAISDWWAWLATVLFTATGQPPFGSGPQATILGRVIAGTPNTSGLPAAVAEKFQELLTTSLQDFPAWEIVLEELEASAIAAESDENMDLTEPATLWLPNPEDEEATTKLNTAEYELAAVEPGAPSASSSPENLEPTETIAAPQVARIQETLPLPAALEPATTRLPVSSVAPAGVAPMGAGPIPAPIQWEQAISPTPQPVPGSPWDPQLAAEYHPFSEGLEAEKPKPMMLWIPRLALGALLTLGFFFFPIPVSVAFFIYAITCNTFGYIWQQHQLSKSGAVGNRWLRLLGASLYAIPRGFAFTLVAGLLGVAIAAGVFTVLGERSADLPDTFDLPRLLLSQVDWVSLPAQTKLTVAITAALAYLVYWLSPTVASHRRFTAVLVGKMFVSRSSRVLVNLSSLILLFAISGMAYSIYTGN